MRGRLRFQPVFTLTDALYSFLNDAAVSLKHSFDV